MCAVYGAYARGRLPDKGGFPCDLCAGLGAEGARSDDVLGRNSSAMYAGVCASFSNTGI